MKIYLKISHPMEVLLNRYFNLQTKFINGVYSIENLLILFQMATYHCWETRRIL